MTSVVTPTQTALPSHPCALAAVLWISTIFPQRKHDKCNAPEIRRDSYGSVELFDVHAISCRTFAGVEFLPVSTISFRLIAITTRAIFFGQKKPLRVLTNDSYGAVCSN